MGFPHPVRPSLFHPTQPHLPAFLLNTTHRLPACSPAPNTCSQQHAWTQPGLSRASPSCRIKLVILQTHLMKGHQTAPCHPKDTRLPHVTPRAALPQPQGRFCSWQSHRGAGCSSGLALSCSQCQQIKSPRWKCNPLGAQQAAGSPEAFPKGRPKGHLVQIERVKSTLQFII